LQEAGWLDIQLISFPRIALLGIYPTAQTVLAQLLVVAVLAVGFWYNTRAAKASASAP
jgi:high-affinity iron transporter